MKKKIPNMLTNFRIFLTVILVILLLFPFYSINIQFKTYNIEGVILSSKEIIAGIIFIIASLTDLLDGYFARKFNVISDYGKFMDAIADKILVNSILIIFAATGQISALIPVIIVSRDTIVDSIRMLAATNNKVIAAGKMGKIKTATLMIAITLTFFGNLPFEMWDVRITEVLYIIATALCVYSGFEYYYLNKNKLFKKD